MAPSPPPAQPLVRPPLASGQPVHAGAARTDDRSGGGRSGAVVGAAALAAGVCLAIAVGARLPAGTAGAWSGPLVTAALALAVAGAAKALRPRGATAALSALGLPGGPGPVRLVGAGEVALGSAAALVGGALAAAGVAGCYLGFAAVTAALRRRPDGPGCGCFGQDDDVVPGRLHLALNLVVAAMAAAAATTSAGGALAVAGSELGPAVLASSAVAAGLLVSAYTVAPQALAAAASHRTPGGGGPAPFALVEEVR